MKILSLDSAAAGCGVCLWQDGRVIADRLEGMLRGQDARLIPLVQETMFDAGWEFDALDRIAVTRGPGSFTGLRVGLAAARGMGFASGKPVLGIDRFSVFRQACQTAGRPLLVVLDSRRAELYTCWVEADGAMQAPKLLTVEQIVRELAAREEGRLAGDCPELLPELADSGRWVQPASSESVCAAALAAAAVLDDPAFLPRPLYLRPPDVTMKGCAS
ncbi:MAG: tRNA (adenosine(37)-N6)-threonylcarbamoyltransferase complex dimerization subunit type 1 TsaB [Bdellovibrionales bacterium]